MPRTRPRDDEDDDDDRPRPRKKKRRRRGGSSHTAAWVMGGTVLGLALVAVIVVVIRSSRGDNADAKKPQNTGDAIRDARDRLPDPADGVIAFDTAFPPAHWTHQDFADFLRSQKVGVAIRPDPALRSPHGEGVWFEDTRDLKRGNRKGRLRVYRCPTHRDALRQVAAMRPEVWLPYAAGNFAIGFDSKDDVTDEDLEFSTHLKGAFFKPRP
jgi:hypothetical protein